VTAQKHHAPIEVLRTAVAADWVDYNGHMNDAAYALVFSRSIDALMDKIGLDAAARKRTGQTLYTMQTMLHFFKEAQQGDALAVSACLLEHDDKRMRVWLEMTSAAGERLAASEQLLLSVMQREAQSKAAPWTFETRAALDALAHAHASIARPELAGQGVALKRPG